MPEDVTSAPGEASPKRVIGRYALYDEIAAGGMATVHFGRLLGPVGFSRTVAIKRLHPQFAKDPEFVSMFLDEARLAARIRHPNVVPTLDVVATQGELFLVMDYVQGESLSRLVRAARDQGTRLPPRILATVMSGALSGLHAAHEARNERGEALNIVHRDVSPQNILVGQDGVPRVLDFGVAKAAGRIQTTREGQLKGKLAYMAPEQISGGTGRQTDIFAASVVFWEALTGRRLFAGDNEGMILAKLLNAPIEPPSQYAPEAAPYDAVVLKGLERDTAARWKTAREMAIAIERCGPVASANEVGEWVETMATQQLHLRARKIAEIESSSSTMHGGVPTATQIASGNFGQTQSLAQSPPSPAGFATIASGPPTNMTIPQGVSAPALPPPPSDVRNSEPSTQMSSISVSTPRQEAPRRKSGAALVLLLAGSATLLAIAVVAVVLVVKSSRATSHPTASAPSSAPSAIAGGPGGGATQQSPSAVASSVTSAAPPNTGPTTTVDPTATSKRPTTAVVATPNIHHTAAPTTTTAPTATATVAATKPNCDPPFTLDSLGHKKWKTECLGN